MVGAAESKLKEKDVLILELTGALAESETKLMAVWPCTIFSVSRAVLSLPLSESFPNRRFTQLRNMQQPTPRSIRICISFLLLFYDLRRIHAHISSLPTCGHSFCATCLDKWDDAIGMAARQHVAAVGVYRYYSEQNLHGVQSHGS